MKERKTRSKFTIFVLACFVLFASVWAGRTYAYFTASSNANGTITMGTLKFDGNVTAEADTDTSLKVVPNQTVNRTYQAKVKSDIKYYKRVCLTASVDVVSGKTHKTGCGDNVADDMSILDMKIADYKSIIADEVTYYYVLSPVTPSSSNITTEEFTINLTLKDWVGKGGCDYYMGATINLNVKIEVIQADYLEERGEASAFTDVQTMHDVWTSIFGGESGTPGDDEVHDVSYYSDTLEFKVISEDAKTMSVQKASGTSTASIDPVENTTTGLKKVQNKNVGTSGSTLTIPSQVIKDGVTYTVTEIPDGEGQVDLGDDAEEGAYYYSGPFSQSTYTEVILPDTLTKIGVAAFAQCPNLESINIPNSVTIINAAAFVGCSSLTTINIPRSVREVGLLTFADSGLISVNCNAQVLGGLVFYNCTALQTVKLGNSVTDMVSSTFMGCSNLKYVTMSDNIAFIGGDEFQGNCPNLVYNVYNNAKYLGNSTNPYVVLIEANSTDITSCTISSDCKYIGYGAFSGCTKLTSISIPESVTNISDRAFNGCTSLTYNTYNNATYLGNESNPYKMLFKAISTDITSCEINSNCEIIGYSAFYGCASLTSITIPNSVKFIGTSAFNQCSNLSSVTLGSGLAYISGLAFYGCSSLTSITIPSGVTNIGENAFKDCTNLTSVTLTNQNNWFVVWSGNSDYLDVSDPTVNASKIKGSWGDGIMRYDESTLEGTVLYINGNVGEVAYAERTDITEVVFGDDVYSIGAEAFAGCTNLTSITLGKNVTYIGMGAFGETSITSLTIPASVKLIDAIAFAAWSENCMDQTLTEYIVESGNPYYKAIDGVLYSKDGKTLISYPYAKTGSSFTIPNGVTTLATGAFAANQYLTSITMPDSVTVAELSSFFYLPNLSSISISNNITEFSIGDLVSSSLMGAVAGTMWGCLYDNFQVNFYENGYYLGNSSNPYLVLVYVEPTLEDGETALTNLVVHDGCKVISNWAFSDLTNSITSISIPDSVEHIGEFAYTFDWIASYMNDGNGNLVDENGNVITDNFPTGLTYSDNGLYLGTTNNPYKMLLYVIPDLTKDVLTEFVINSKCEIIGYCAFALLDDTDEDGTKLGAITTINIPASVKYIHTLGLANSTISSITVDSGNLYYKAVDGVLYSKDGKTLIYYPSAKAGTSFTVSSNVTKVELFAFLNNPNLITLTIPDTVKSINMYSIGGNVNIETINISGDFMMTNLMGRFMLLNMLNYVSTNEVTSSEWLLDNCWLGEEGFNSSELPMNSILDGEWMLELSMLKVMYLDRV